MDIAVVIQDWKSIPDFLQGLSFISCSSMLRCKLRERVGTLAIEADFASWVFLDILKGRIDAEASSDFVAAVRQWLSDAYDFCDSLAEMINVLDLEVSDVHFPKKIEEARSKTRGRLAFYVERSTALERRLSGLKSDFHHIVVSRSLTGLVYVEQISRLGEIAKRNAEAKEWLKWALGEWALRKTPDVERIAEMESSFWRFALSDKEREHYVKMAERAWYGVMTDAKNICYAIQLSIFVLDERRQRRALRLYREIGQFMAFLEGESMKSIARTRETYRNLFDIQERFSQAFQVIARSGNKVT